ALGRAAPPPLRARAVLRAALRRGSAASVPGGREPLLPRPGAVRRVRATLRGGGRGRRAHGVRPRRPRPSLHHALDRPVGRPGESALRRPVAVLAGRQALPAHARCRPHRGRERDDSRAGESVRVNRDVVWIAAALALPVAWFVVHFAGLVTRPLEVAAWSGAGIFGAAFL